jgi:deoxyhypusine synthase
MDVKEFIKSNFRHFNAAVVVDAAEAWGKHLKKKGKMLLTMAGALSTGEIGISLSEMIRKDKIHAICCTGANLEEDIFNLIAHKSYKRIPHYRQLTPKEELDLKRKHLNRGYTLSGRRPKRRTKAIFLMNTYINLYAAAN